MSTLQPSMMIYARAWQNRPSFSLLPLTADCPYAEVIYDPATRALAVISKLQRETPQMLPRLDDKGRMRPRKQLDVNDAPYEEQRVLMHTYYEHFLTEPRDIEAFLDAVAVNPACTVRTQVLEQAAREVVAEQEDILLPTGTAVL